jgi:hypothetical protein
MARKNPSRPASAARTSRSAQRVADHGPRDFLLAGIGAVSLGRKRLLSAYANGFQELVVVRDRAQDAVIAAAASLDQQVDALRRRADRWQAQARAYRDQVEHRFGPLLGEFGLPVRKPRKRKPVRKAARKPARRRA